MSERVPIKRVGKGYDYFTSTDGMSSADCRDCDWSSPAVPSQHAFIEGIDHTVETGHTVVATENKSITITKNRRES